MLDLESAIIHCEEVVREQEEDASKWEYTLGVYRRRDYCEPSTIPACEKELKRCKECAEEHRQLADWLKLLKRILDSGDCNECGIKKYCQVVPPLGEQVRYNCPLFVRKEQEEGGEE